MTLSTFPSFKQNPPSSTSTPFLPPSSISTSILPFKGLHKHTTNYPLPSQSAMCRQSLAKTPEFLFMHLLAKKKGRKIRKSEISTVEPSIANLTTFVFRRADPLEGGRVCRIAAH